MAIIRRIAPAPDSHFRLRDHGAPCGGRAEYLEFDSGTFAVRCTRCGRRTPLSRVRHTVQVEWNQRGCRDGRV